MKNITIKWALFFPHFYSYYYVEEVKQREKVIKLEKTGCLKQRQEAENEMDSWKVLKLLNSLDQHEIG